MEYKPDICFYHFPCSDGFGAAYAIWNRWPDTEFIPINHGDPISVSQYKDKHVLFVDFSVKENAMKDMNASAKSIVVLDHHASAEKALSYFTKFDGHLKDLEAAMEEFYDDVYVHFNMNRSGAALAWNFANPGTFMPWAIRYIEDRDLWKWEYDESKAFDLATASKPKDFEYWRDNIISNNDTYNLVREGEAILSYQESLIKQIAKNAYIDIFVDGYNAGHAVWHVNTSVLQSEVGNYLINLYPDTPFVAVWNETKDGKIRYSLRSEAGRADVSLIAASLGGGGHAAAAGCMKEKKL